MCVSLSWILSHPLFNSCLCADSLAALNLHTVSARFHFVTMGVRQSKPPVVLVPPIFDRHELLTRSRMAESSYDVLFGKVAREVLFVEYYALTERMMTSIILKPLEDPNVDFSVRVSNTSSGELKGDAVFRWQRSVEDPDTFLEFQMGSLTKDVKVRACTFHPKTGFGTFCSFPCISKNRWTSENQNIVGVRYGSPNLSIGTTLDWFSKGPSQTWLVGKIGKITAGCQFKPRQYARRSSWQGYPVSSFGYAENWSFAIDYGGGKRGILDPSFNFCLEFRENSKMIVSYYHHLVLQRQVKNPFEEEEVVAITNYIDLGFEFLQRLEARDSTEADIPTIQIGALWQVNKNICLKGKLGVLNSGVALMLRSWGHPSVTLSCSYMRDHMQQKTNVGFGVRLENVGHARYEGVDPNYVMFTPNRKDPISKPHPMPNSNMSNKNNEGAHLMSSPPNILPDTSHIL